MAEGNQHRALVQRLERFAILMQDEFPYLMVSLDLPGSKWQRPPRIGGHVPDMLAQTVPRTMSVIGEAKSERDLESGRSAEQIGGYIRYLRSVECAALLLAVPWPVAATARAVVNKAKSAVEDSNNVSLLLLDGVICERSMVAKLCR